MIWYDMIWYDMIWYDMIYDMIWYDDMIICMISYHIISYYMISYHISHHIISNYYDMWHNMALHDKYKYQYHLFTSWRCFCGWIEKPPFSSEHYSIPSVCVFMKTDTRAWSTQEKNATIKFFLQRCRVYIRS